MKRIIAASAFGASSAIAIGYLMRSRSLQSRIAIVTGGSRGLGLAIAQELVAAGCRVAICARDGDELEEAASLLRDRGGDVLAVTSDVADEDQAHMLVERTIDHFGGVDIVVNNAGTIQVGPVADLTTANFRDAMDAMLWGTVNTTIAVLPYMCDRRSGHIVNITSIGGKVSAPHLLPYNTAKFAAVGFSEGLHSEAARHHIHVTTVVPGLMRTGSDVQARFSGKGQREHAWFAVAAATPGLSMDGQHAARRIVQAIARRRSEIVLTLPAKAAVRAHGIAPATTQDVLSWINRLLPAPAPGPHGETVAGQDLAANAPPVVQALTTPNRRAGERLNQPSPGE
jgi:NAD(P)-dependent dehydrogenase (short-subunit alcohol dehydrogenase family)